MDCITEKNLNVTCAITAARGRGKSACLGEKSFNNQLEFLFHPKLRRFLSGMAVGGAIAFGYTNIFITSPSPENVRTLFEFIIKALEILDYEVRFQAQRNTWWKVTVGTHGL